MCRITDETLLPIWMKGFGSTYHEVTGRNLVKRFKYYDETFSVGDVIELYVEKTMHVSVTAEIVTVGSNMQVAANRNIPKTSRRAIIFKTIRCSSGAHTVGETFPAFLWGHSPKRMRHSALETLARI